MMTGENINEELVGILAVMAEPVRIRILQLIASRGTVCARDILPEFAITQPTLSHHMRLLVENNLVTEQRSGRYSCYSINHDTVDQISGLLASLNEPPIVATTPEGVEAARRKTEARRTKMAGAQALKKTSSVPIPQKLVEGPDLDRLKKNKKKKLKDKDKEKKKDKKKKK